MKSDQDIMKDKVFALVVEQRDTALADLAKAREERDTTIALNAKLIRKWESKEPGTPGRIFIALADKVAEICGTGGLSSPPSQHIEEYVATLRTDLLSAQDELKSKERECEELKQESLSAQAKLAAALVDTKRVDWMESQDGILAWDDNGYWFYQGSGPAKPITGTTPRDAIDAAMSAQH